VNMTTFQIMVVVLLAIIVVIEIIKLARRGL
jgi:hypothetical protein